MLEAEELSGLIEQIYDAALDASLRAGVLSGAAGFIRACAANLFWQDVTSNDAAVFHSWGDDPRYRELYFQKYATLNPYFPALSFFEIGTVHGGVDIMPHAEFPAHPVLPGVDAAAGFIDALFANLEKSPTSVASFSVRRTERDGVVDDEARRRFGLLVPHIQRAVGAHRVRANSICMSAGVMPNRRRNDL